MNKPTLPQSDSIQELAQFWDTHDVTDFEDQLEEVIEPVFAKSQSMTLHLPVTAAEAIHVIAQAKGVTDEELLQEWVREKLQTP